MLSPRKNFSHLGRSRKIDKQFILKILLYLASYGIDKTPQMSCLAYRSKINGVNNVIIINKFKLKFEYLGIRKILNNPSDYFRITNSDLPRQLNEETISKMINLINLLRNFLNNASRNFKLRTIPPGLMKPRDKLVCAFNRQVKTQR